MEIKIIQVPSETAGGAVTMDVIWDPVGQAKDDVASVPVWGDIQNQHESEKKVQHEEGKGDKFGPQVGQLDRELQLAGHPCF